MSKQMESLIRSRRWVSRVLLFILCFLALGGLQTVGANPPYDHLNAGPSLSLSTGMIRTFNGCPSIAYVEPGSNCGGASPCYSSIYSAIDAACPDAVIKVGEGTYTQNVTIDKAVTLEFGWSADFKTLNQPNPAVIAGPSDELGMISPADGSTFYSDRVVFNWHNTSPMYRLIVGPSCGTGDYADESGITTGYLGVSGLPIDGSPVCAQLQNYATGLGSYTTVAAYNYHAVEGPAIEVVQPEPGSVLESNKETFQWNPPLLYNGRNIAKEYYLRVGSSGEGSSEFMDQTISDPNTIRESVPGLPDDGSTVYVRLGYRTEGDHESYVDRTYTANTFYTRIYSPMPHPYLIVKNHMAFKWKPLKDAVSYGLYFGPCKGCFEGGWGGGTLLGPDETGYYVSNLPEDLGRELWIRLWYRRTGDPPLFDPNCPYTDHPYTLPWEPPAWTFSPSSGASLTRSTQFSWENVPPSGRPMEYLLQIGTERDAADIYNALITTCPPGNYSVAVTDDRLEYPSRVFVNLRWRVRYTGTPWHDKFYSGEYNNTAAFSSPPSDMGYVLKEPQTFEWTDIGAAEYGISWGTVFNPTEYGQLGYDPGTTMATIWDFGDIPAGETIYVYLWYPEVAGDLWGAATPKTKHRYLAPIDVRFGWPLPGSPLPQGNSIVEFKWNKGTDEFEVLDYELRLSTSADPGDPADIGTWRTSCSGDASAQCKVSAAMDLDGGTPVYASLYYRIAGRFGLDWSGPVAQEEYKAQAVGDLVPVALYTMNSPGVDTRRENPGLAATTVYDWSTLFVEVVVWLNCLDNYDPDDHGAWLGDKNILVKLDGEWSGGSSFLETEFNARHHSMRFNYPYPINFHDEELNLKVKMHDAYTSLTGQRRWTYYPDITGIDIFDHQSQLLNRLGAPDTGLPWEYDHLYFFNMMHAINYFNEHYNLHGAPYPVYLAFDDTYADPGFNFAVFTFEIDTTRFAANVGEWNLTVTVDPYDDIEEANDELNNVYAVTAEPAFLIDTSTEVAEELLGPEEIEAFAACDPDFYQSPLEEIQVVLDRARWADNFGWHWNHEWWEANSASGIDESDGFVPRPYDWAFNIDNEALDRAEEIHLTEFYGPYGWGKIKREAGDWELIYGNAGDCGGPGQLPCRPRPSEIKNVFLFSTGNANGSADTIGAGTQNEPNDNYCTPSGASGLDDESIASCIKSAHKFCGSSGEWIRGEHIGDDCSHNIKFGSMFTQIIENEDDYLEYGPENSLLTSIWTHNYKAANIHKDVVRHMWFRYLADRTNNFSSVENFVCGGNSRGGMLCLVLAKMIQSYKNGVDHPDIPDAFEAAHPYTPDPPDKDLRVVVLGITPSNVHEGDGLILHESDGLFLVSDFIFNNSLCDAYYPIRNNGLQYYGNGTCYDFNFLFPSNIRDDLYVYLMADNNFINRGFIHFHNCSDGYERPYYPCTSPNVTSNWPYETPYCRYDTDTVPDNSAGTYAHQYFTPPFTMPANNQGPSFLWQSWRSITHSNMCGDWTKWYNLWNALDFMGWKFGWLTDPAVSFSENRPECSD